MDRVADADHMYLPKVQPAIRVPSVVHCNAAFAPTRSAPVLIDEKAFVVSLADDVLVVPARGSKAETATADFDEFTAALTCIPTGATALWLTSAWTPKEC